MESTSRRSGMSALLGAALVIVGGIIPKEDIPLLKASGVDEVLPVHSTLVGIANFIRDRVSRRREEEK